MFGDVTDPASVRDIAFASPVDVVVSCLASRTGGKVIYFSLLSRRVVSTLPQLCSILLG